MASPIVFDGVNHTPGRMQKGRRPLPVQRALGTDPDGNVSFVAISCWHLSDKEVEEIVRTRQIWILQEAEGSGLTVEGQAPPHLEDCDPEPPPMPPDLPEEADE